jgi:hypothetical protein
MRRKDDNRLLSSLVFVTIGRVIYISVCDNGVNIVRLIATRVIIIGRGRAAQVPRGGCATSPPTIRHNNKMRARQNYEV